MKFTRVRASVLTAFASIALVGMAATGASAAEPITHTSGSASAFVSGVVVPHAPVHISGSKGGVILSAAIHISGTAKGGALVGLDAQ